MAETYTDRVLSLPALAFWKCDEAAGNLADMAGGYTAVVSGAPTYGVPGPFVGAPKAVSLPGVNTNYFTATVPNGSTLDTADVFSIGWWVKPTIGAIMEIVSRPTNGYDFRINADGRIDLTKTFVASILSSTPALANAAWAFVGVTKNGGAVTLYIDGLPAGTVGGAVAILNNVGNVVIGRNAQDGALPFNGSMGRGFITNVALADAQWLAIYQAATVQTRPVTTTCVWREPNPPHAALFVTELGGAKWSQRIRGMATASILVPRSDANAANVAKLLARCVPMVTLERSDGAWPFVGFPVNPRFRASDTHGAIQLADHTMLLQQANTRLIAESRKASGTFILDELREMDTRADPRLGLDLRNVGSGPAASLAMSGQNGDSLLRELEKQTGYEAYFTYAISPAGVVTYLNWQPMQGKDRRAEDRWIDGEQLADAQYGFDYRKGKRSVTSVGGTGAVTARNSATANTSGGRAIGSSVEKVATARRAGIGGSSVEFAPQTTDAQVLAARSKQALLAPANSAVSWEFQIVESAVDPAQISGGDIRRISSDTAFMGQPVTGIARIIGLSFDLGEGVAHAVAVEAE